MIKYKLIKKYPGSPNVGDFAIYDDESIHFKISNSSFKPRSWLEITEYPEFWKKIVEKDYEILAFYYKNIAGKGDNHIDPNYLWFETSKGSGKWSRMGHITHPYNTDEILQHPSYGIYSVKRLSDGEIFTVGDKVDGTSYKNIIINSVDINPTLTVQIQINHKDEGINLLTAKKAKQPLFKTADGVDIYEGDNWVRIRLSDFSILGIYGDAIGKIKTFSTKEAAEEYVIMNKPCLSINDIITPGKVFEVTLNDVYIDKLKQIVKNKL